MLLTCLLPQQAGALRSSDTTTCSWFRGLADPALTADDSMEAADCLGARIKEGSLAGVVCSQLPLVKLLRQLANALEVQRVLFPQLGRLLLCSSSRGLCPCTGFLVQAHHAQRLAHRPDGCSMLKCICGWQGVCKMQETCSMLSNLY